MERKQRVAWAGVAAVLAMAAAPASGGGAAYGSYQRLGTNALVSVDGDGGQVEGSSFFASISGDGTLVAFASKAWGLVDHPIGETGEIYLRDVVAGTTTLVSRSSTGEAANGGSLQPQISADGSTVVFLSDATNLAAADPSDGRGAQVYAYDVASGVVELISASADGGPTDGSGLQPRVSADGRLVTWHSGATNLVSGDTNGQADVFLHDRATGETRRLSVRPDGAQGDGSSVLARISGDGSTVVYATYATNLIEEADNGVRDLVAVDVDTLAAELVSVSSDGSVGNYDSTFSDISFDGSTIAFMSGASNLVPNDWNGLQRAIDGFDVFVRDRDAGTTERVSLSSVGEELVSSHAPSISADGRFVGFASIKPGEDVTSFTAPADVYVHDRWTHATEVLSATHGGSPGTGDSDNPVFSDDGSVVAFQTDAPDLVPGDANGSTDVVIRQRGRDLGVLGLDTGGFAYRDLRGRVAVAGIPLLSGEDASEQSESTADIIAASVIYRPEDADLLFSLDLADLAATPMQSGVPGVYETGGLPRQPVPTLTYGLRFALDGVAYDLRASVLGGTLSGPTGDAQVTNPSPEFSLYRCNPNCVRVAAPGGGLGTAGQTVRISLPLAPLGLEPGESLTDLTAVTGYGEGASGPVVEIDTLALGDLTVPALEATLTIGGEDLLLTPSWGRFVRNFAERIPAGTTIDVRLCLGSRCVETDAIL